MADLAHVPAEVLIRKQQCHGSLESLNIAAGHQDSVRVCAQIIAAFRSSFREIYETTYVGGYEGASRGHGLDDGHGCPLIDRCRDDQIHTGINPRHAALPARENNVRGKAAPGYLVLHGMTERTVSNHNEL